MVNFIHTMFLVLSQTSLYARRFIHMVASELACQFHRRSRQMPPLPGEQVATSLLHFHSAK